METRQVDEVKGSGTGGTMSKGNEIAIEQETGTECMR